jgi:hypothetical protein
VTWTKLDDSFYDDPKILGVGNEAVGVYARLLSYCGRHETDGTIPSEVAGFVGRPKVLLRLIDAGLLEQLDNAVRIPQYLKFNPSHKTLEAKREADRKRKAAA